MKVHYSSATNEWETPQYLYNWLDGHFHFTLDPCCTVKTAKCKLHLTAEEDGLRYDWAPHNVFMNPPYGREIGHWIQKAYEEALKGATVVCLIPARTDTKWWYKYCTKAHTIIFFTGRVKFLNEGQELPMSAPFPSCTVIFKPQTPEPLKVRWIPLDKIKSDATLGI